MAITQTLQFGAAAATSPGKHGPDDWRVTFLGRAPRHAEVIFMLGFLLLAEDRYNDRAHLGRYLLWYFVDRLQLAKSSEQIMDIATDCAEAVANPASLVRGRP